MPMPTKLPKGCSTSRGAADVHHVISLGGDAVKMANRLYMLSVKRQSLLTKINTWTMRLQEAQVLLAAIDADRRHTESIYKKLETQEGGRKSRRKKTANSPEQHLKKMALCY